MKGGFASIGHQVTRQRTCNGMKVVSRNRTWKGNPAGFYVYVNQIRYFVNSLDRTAAEQIAINKYREALALCCATSHHNYPVR